MATTSQNKTLFEDYDGFVEKFKPKKTTDDCYTPPIIYDAVADWAANEYKLNKSDFVRPFYPRGDFERFDYKPDSVVVDNPPFSILSKIVNFYVNNGVKFFLFAPTLSGVIRYSDSCTALAVGVDITYENGAVVHTSFITNLEPHEIRIKTAPTLYAAVDTANKTNKADMKKEIAKYKYPPELITAAQLYPFNKYGIEFEIPRKESARVGKLDAQMSGKGIFGCGLLLSERLTAERERAERERAERERAERERAERERAERERAIVFPLSNREKEIVKYLSRNS